jgi:hypothetical protein
MLKKIALVVSFAFVAPGMALACEMHSSHPVQAEATVASPQVILTASETVAPPAAAVVAPQAAAPEMQSDRETMTRALQSLPFEPTTSLNNNPYEVNCTRNKKETVYYTN